MNYYLSKKKKTKRSYWYAFFTDPNDSQKVLFSLSIESLRRKIGLPTQLPVTREREAYAIVERAITEGIISNVDKTIKFIPYVLDFWDFDNSEYIIRRNQKAPNSIGKDYALTMRSNFKNHAIPHLPPNIDLDAVTTLHIENVVDALLDEGKLSNATIQKVIQSMSGPLREARRKRIIPYNPVDGVEPLTSTYKKRGIFTVEEINKILDYLLKKGTEGVVEDWNVRGKNKTTQIRQTLVKIDLKPYLAVKLATYTGMRMGEVRALCSEQIEFVDDRFGIIEVDRAYNNYAGNKTTKGKRTRKVPVPRQLCEDLLDMAAQNPHNQNTRVFWIENNPENPISSNYISLHFYKALNAIGIDEEERISRNLSFHSLRHTFNSTLRGKITDKALRFVVGHESAAMTDRYTHEQLDELIDVGTTVEALFADEIKDPEESIKV